LPEQDPSRIAIVGCGAVVEQSYLPALQYCRGVRCEALIDPDGVRTEALAGRYGIPATAARIEDMPAGVAGVVVAVPNSLHVPVVTRALSGGVHVLCEKPLGRTVSEVDAMVAVAAQSRRELFAAMVCRRYPAVREAVTHDLKRLVGDIRGIDASYGFPLDWPVKSTAYFDREASGGGALLDFGAHLIDALLHVTGATSFEVSAYADDADAGVDAEAEGRVVLFVEQRRVECTVRASRLRRLPNAVILHGDHNTLDIPLSPMQPATLRVGSGSWPVSGSMAGSLQCFIEQLEDFGRAIRNDTHQLPCGASQRATIALIEAMYARRQPLVFSWDA